MLMRFAGVALALTLLATPRTALAQTNVTPADVQRLQDTIADTSRDIAQLRSRDASLASDLQSELDGARDEATYLKVKLQKNETISRGEYTDLRDRIETIRSRARGEATSPRHGNEPTAITDTPPDSRADRPWGTVGHSANPNEIPVGTEFDVRLQNSLSSATAQPEDRFQATTMVDLRDEAGRVLVPAGSTMRGIVNSVHKATRLERKGSLTVAFDRVTINGRAYPMRATVTQALESEGIAGEKEKIGIGAGAGAILGAILGGAKGALAGILIGGGGSIAATEGDDVQLPTGTVLRVRLDSPLQLQR
ncbi:MAG TPA: hypothetical protein VFA27_07550 [Vicinamibacterales bacterium]|nr:hypothetical protein [Vicinamibacterales bacterium]